MSQTKGVHVKGALTVNDNIEWPNEGFHPDSEYADKRFKVEKEEEITIDTYEKAKRFAELQGEDLPTPRKPFDPEVDDLDDYYSASYVKDGIYHFFTYEAVGFDTLEEVNAYARETGWPFNTSSHRSKVPEGTIAKNFPGKTDIRVYGWLVQDDKGNLCTQWGVMVGDGEEMEYMFDSPEKAHEFKRNLSALVDTPRFVQVINHAASGGDDQPQLSPDGSVRPNSPDPAAG